MQITELGELGRMDAAALLDSRGVAGALHEPLLAFAGGRPLASRSVPRHLPARVAPSGPRRRSVGRARVALDLIGEHQVANVGAVH
ncbi:hypothetical protein [Streptomyces sp. XD-27]|uniref:hypothetical protein n=1 Tax=Streptomyces sp. XD-27 TaxID=3062779 RepID=UPI0026F433A6|nr:hypothetical protein [Streptomyces sp. XD-27]WKX68587.1 hypothetical protein Q3Y56_00220 [Streptomyces sp. XD-27]